MTLAADIIVTSEKALFGSTGVLLGGLCQGKLRY